MARKEPVKDKHARGLSDIIGIILIASSLLLVVAQLSFHRNDVSPNSVPPNPTVHNWIGGAGAYGAFGLFFMFGAGAYVIPMILSGASAYMTYEAGEQTSVAMLISLIGLAISLWAFVELGCLRGTVGPNQYGPDPIAPQAGH